MDLNSAQASQDWSVIYFDFKIQKLNLKSAVVDTL